MWRDASDNTHGSAGKADFVQTYTASATAGEVVTSTLDTHNLTYAYVYSVYGLTGATGSGPLVARLIKIKNPRYSQRSGRYGYPQGERRC